MAFQGEKEQQVTTGRQGVDQKGTQVTEEPESQDSASRTVRVGVIRAEACGSSRFPCFLSWFTLHLHGSSSVEMAGVQVFPSLKAPFETLCVEISRSPNVTGFGIF